MLKEQFPDWDYGEPASAEAIADAEESLGVRFPDELRALYLEADGARENAGNAAYLLPLSALVSTTRSEWAEWEGFRAEYDLKPFIFFGLSTSDHAWGINWMQPGQVIVFHPHMEGAYEVAGTHIIDVYRADFAEFKRRFPLP
ncbi:SMI1/KNR4 family protein [Variovorax sp. UC122_21]|uniref:SMI1/KNR4 family protein n=1 Tax=Variovorax sp. UC122_21 TaxID=3374554 RepID=UPI00375796AC